MALTKEGWSGTFLILSVPLLIGMLYVAGVITDLFSVVESVLVWIFGSMIVAGTALLYRGWKKGKSPEENLALLDDKFRHIEARFFYPPKHRWEKTRVLKKHWWEIWKQAPSHHKLAVVKDLRKAYYVGTYVWNLIAEGKIEWFSEEEQDLREWCTKAGYELVRENASEDKLLEPYFEAEIKDKKPEYRQGETVFFRTHYRGKLTNGFFDNQITPLSGQILPNGRQSYWRWDPETLPNPNSGGKLEGYITHTSSWDWSIPQDAPAGKYRVIMGVLNHFDMETRPRVAHKEETITVISRRKSGSQKETVETAPVDIPTFSEIDRIMSTEEMQSYRKIIYENAEIIKQAKEVPLELGKTINYVATRHDRVAVILKDRPNDKKRILEWIGEDTLLKTWKIIEPYIDNERHRRNNQNFVLYYEQLMKEYEKEKSIG